MHSQCESHTAMFGGMEGRQQHSSWFGNRGDAEPDSIDFLPGTLSSVCVSVCLSGSPHDPTHQNAQLADIFGNTPRILPVPSPILNQIPNGFRHLNVPELQNTTVESVV